jgi:hypothetical protein
MSLGASLFLAGCLGASDDEKSGRLDDALRRGGAVQTRPEVGRLSLAISSTSSVMCTGTLVGPRVVLTASHCVGYKSASVGDTRRGTFRIEAEDGVHVYAYGVDGFQSFSKTVGGDDVALLHLSSSVPPAVAKPVTLASARPAKGTTVTVYGYGYDACTFTTTTRIDKGISGVKRAFTFAYGTNPHALCGGDSGGPVFVGDSIFAVNSATESPSGSDIFAFVDDQYAALAKQIGSWAPAPDASDGRAPSTSPDAAAPSSNGDGENAAPTPSGADGTPPESGAGSAAPAADRGGCQMTAPSRSMSTDACWFLLFAAYCALWRRRRSGER